MSTSPRRRGRDAARDPQRVDPPRVDSAPNGLAEPPWARVRGVQLIRREIREMLSPGGIQVLFDHADLVVEGGEELGSQREADRRVFATVMITIDLGCCADYFREPADEATARRVAELMAGDPQVQQQLHSMAARELARLAGCEPSALALAIETAMRVEGPAVLIDLDAMATLTSTPTSTTTSALGEGRG